MKRLTDALAAKGSDYAPRTRHKNADGSPKYLNRLILETSPYLLQHAHNPVNWNAWGDEAFARARAEGKPVLLSVGYSTCHWCHVMERESFEDEEIARFLNEHFVAIKVDREERPDIDDVYMTAVNALTGRGGWPMTIVMTPDKQPFFAGTYFPARDGDRGPGKGFLTILGELARAFRDHRAELVAHAAEVSRHLAQAPSAAAGRSVLPDAGVIEAAAAMYLAAFDEVNGGFGDAPKFPRPVVLELLLRYHRRSGDAHALVAVERTLQKMQAGGVYDHVAGGFHRYSTDARWLVPHFEKMLYDNAQLAVVYLEAWQVTKNPEYARVTRDILDYLDREMSDPRGGFYSATDADSLTPGGHEEEGWFFTWTPAELDAVLGLERGELVRSYFGVTARGNFEGRNILFMPKSHDDAARGLGWNPTELRTEIEGARRLLRDARASRPAPHRDDKVLTSWNALAIIAFARAGFALDDARYLSRAARGAEFLLMHHRGADGTLLRSSRGGAAQIEGYLDDYAFLGAALLDLFEATGEQRWLDAAIDQQRRLDEGFADAGAGGYFMTSVRHEALLLRQKPDYDGAEPSGNSIAAENLVRLAELTSDDAYRQRALRTVAALARGGTEAPRLLCALDFLLDDAREIVLVSPDASSAKPLLDVIKELFLPNRVLALVVPTSRPVLAITEGKQARDGRATAYVCVRGACELPTTDPLVLRRQLAAVKPLRGSAPR